MKHKMPAVIFAGGKSSRMGEDKALLPFGSFPTLAEYQYERLSKIFEKIYLSTKSTKFNFEAPLIQDLYSESSPLVGLVSAFETLDTDEIFILSVDVPFIEENIIKSILKEPSGYDAVIAKNKGQLQPLCGRYSRSILPLAKAELERGNHKLGILLQQANTSYMAFEEKKAFMNLNHPHEYREALKIISS